MVLCKDVERSKIHTCIKQHFKEISAECQTLAKSHNIRSKKPNPPRRAEAKPQTTQQECMAQVKGICKNVERAQIHKCIADHFQEFSAECQALAKSRKGNKAPP